MKIARRRSFSSSGRYTGFGSICVSTIACVSTNTEDFRKEMFSEFKKKLVEWERLVGKKMMSQLFEKKRTSIIFIIGHMRSGSSLLAHIIFSKPSVLGYGETHNEYKRIEDFGAVAARICRKMRKTPIGKKYFLDKVLHKKHIKESELLRHPAVRIVFQTRRPDHALSSIVRNTGRDTPAEALDHYVGQLRYIKKLAKKIDRRKWTHVSYKGITKNTNRSFERLEELLDLSEPLSESYEVTKFTGVAPVGDPGPNISEGRIKRNIDHDIEPSIIEVLDRAKKQHRECMGVLRSIGI